MTEEQAVEGAEGDIETVLRYLRDARLFDFTGYKRGTLTRRIGRRMQQVGLSSYPDYIDYLEVHPEEFEQLFNTILINVSGFFRDPDAWAVVRDRVVPDIVGRRQEGPIRVWSAGCSTGQEAYSAIMLFAERLGIDAARDRVKVYATDLDTEALDRARQAEYTAKEVEGVPADLLERFFQPAGAGFAFSKDLRRSVIFGRHDLLTDALISRTDLLMCRNTLMYFNAEVQAELISRLHFSVANGGYLLLGKVEMVADSDLFEPVDARNRLFRKVNRTSLRSRLLTVAGRATTPSPPVDERVMEMAFELRPNPEVLLDAAGIVLAVNARARDLFGIGADAVGRPFQDMELSYRPVELRSRIDEVRAEGRPVELDPISRWTPSGDHMFLEVRVVPLTVGGQHRGVVIAFVDVTRHRQLQQELEQTHRELEMAYEERQSANEELETTNEELQSTVEELETTNEELQSTNEELETMNEELTSTNEELRVINDELRERTAEVHQVNAYIESVLSTLEASVIVVDRNMQIRVWNGLSFEMWGLRSEEVQGENIFAVDVGFPVEALRTPIRACLQGDDPGQGFTVAAVTRRGHQVRCWVRVAPLRGPEDAVEGAMILISEDRPPEETIPGQRLPSE
jgi:two-component system CheB/CheR fusion protein